MDAESGRDEAAANVTASVREKRGFGARVGAAVRAAAAFLDRGGISPWVPNVPSSWLLLAGLWLLPFMGAGVVRALTGAPLWLSLVAALLVEATLAATFLLRPRVISAEADRSGRWLERAGLALGLLAIGAAFFTLYNRELGALVTYYGEDGGTHMAASRLFVTSLPDAYNGFVSLYAVMHLLGRLLPLGPAGGLAPAFYSTLAVVEVTPLVLMMALLQAQPRRGWARWAGLAAFAVAWAALSRSVVLPLLNNLQVDGFYAHFFGFIPFAFIWAADVLFQSLVLRVFWMGLGIVLCRFTYGLNLADLLVACGVIWLLDAPGARRRVVPVAVGLGTIAAALMAYRQLAPVFAAGGYMEIYALDQFLPIIAIAAVTLVCFGLADALGANWPPRVPSGTAPLSGVWRHVRLPVLCALVAPVALAQLSKLPNCENYYRFKYPLLPAVWLGAAACIAIGYTVFLAAARTRAALIVVVGIAAITVFGHLSARVDDIFTVMQAELADRAGPPPHPKMRPLVDAYTWQAIDDTLKASGKTFGGLVSSDYPISHVLNVLRGSDGPLQTFYPPLTTAGHCVFWTRPEDDAPFAWVPQRPALEAARAALTADPNKVCVTHTPTWAVVPHVLCHRCY